MPGRVGTIIGRAGGLIMGGPGIMGMWPPMGGLIPGLVPRASFWTEGGPSLASWEGLPCGTQASCQAEEGPLQYTKKMWLELLRADMYLVELRGS